MTHDDTPPGPPTESTVRDPKAMVRDGYERASHAYRGDEFDLEKSGYAHWLRRLALRVPEGARVLDLGCGNGVPVTRALSARYRVTGLDLSPTQIERARTLVPGATFVCGDMTAAGFAPASFDAVTAFYSIINVPVHEQAGLIARIAGWLAPGGWLLAIVGRRPWTGTEADWRGVEGVRMFYSLADESHYRTWFAEAGLAIAEEGVQPRRGNPGFAVLIARRGEGALP
jgi:SAM-dependent methyltransferase